MTDQYPCPVCKLEDEVNDNSLQCDLCDRQNYTSYLEISTQKYEKLNKEPLPWYSQACISETSHSQTSNNDFKNQFYSTKTPEPPQVIKKSSRKSKN